MSLSKAESSARAFIAGLAEPEKEGLYVACTALEFSWETLVATLSEKSARVARVRTAASEICSQPFIVAVSGERRYVPEPLRSAFGEALSGVIEPSRMQVLEARLADILAERAVTLSNGQPLRAYRVIEAQLAAAHLRAISSFSKKSEAFFRLWEEAPIHAKDATARAAVAITPGLVRRVGKRPDDLIFLQGVRARETGRRSVARDLFRQLWENGRPGAMYATAAHFFGLLEHDLSVAEAAMNDALEWTDSRAVKGHIYHSLGRRLGKLPARRAEALRSLDKALELLDKPADRGKVLHTKGLIYLYSLSRRSRASRWRAAESAMAESLKLLRGEDKGQAHHTLGQIYATHSGKWKDAEKQFEASLALLVETADRARVWRSYAKLLAKDFSPAEKAEAAFSNSVELAQSNRARAVALTEWAEFRASIGRQSGARELVRRAQKLTEDRRLLARLKRIS